MDVLSKKSHMLYAFETVGSSRKRPRPRQNTQPLKGQRDLGVNHWIPLSLSFFNSKDYYNIFFRVLWKLNDVYTITLHCIHHRIRCSRSYWPLQGNWKSIPLSTHSSLPPTYIISRIRKYKLLYGAWSHDIISTGLLASSYLPPLNQSKEGFRTEYVFIIIPPPSFPFSLFY